MSGLCLRVTSQAAHTPSPGPLEEEEMRPPWVLEPQCQLPHWLICHFAGAVCLAVLKAGLGLKKGLEHTLSPPRPWTVRASAFSAADQFQRNARRLIVTMNCLVH